MKSYVTSLPNNNSNINHVQNNTFYPLHSFQHMLFIHFSSTKELIILMQGLTKDTTITTLLLVSGTTTPTRQDRMLTQALGE